MRGRLFLNDPVKAGRECIEVLLVEFVGCQAETLAEALIVNNFPRAQELDSVADIGIVNKAKNVVICGSGFLFRRHIFVKIGDYVAGGLKICRRER